MSIRSVLFCLPVKSLECSGKKVVVMPMVRVTCDLCGKDFQKLQIEIHKHNFCCREHFYQWNSKRISRYNRTENPMNQPGGVLPGLPAGGGYQPRRLAGGRCPSCRGQAPAAPPQRDLRIKREVCVKKEGPPSGQGPLFCVTLEKSRPGGRGGKDHEIAQAPAP